MGEFLDLYEQTIACSTQSELTSDVLAKLVPRLMDFSRTGGNRRGLADGGPMAGRGIIQRFRPCGLLVSRR